MNRTVLSAAVFCLLRAAAFSENPTTGVLARDDVYAYTISDLQTYLQITEFPDRVELLDAVARGDFKTRFPSWSRSNQPTLALACTSTMFAPNTSPKCSNKRSNPALTGLVSM